jgi:phytoene dehydrogenase-like protein
MPDYDAVVIGAGNGGLTAAVSLAQAGRKVLLLERHNVPGGCATSFIRGRFEFEVALHQLSGMGVEGGLPGPLRMLLSQLGVLDKIEWVVMPHLYRLAIPGELDIVLPADRQGAQEVLRAKFPAEAEGIDQFFDLVWDFCMQMVQGVFLRDPAVSAEKYPTYFRYALQNTQDILDQFFSDPLLQAAVGIYWTYIGLPPSRLSFANLAMVLWAYTELKPFHLKGGSQALSTALLDAFLAAGGEVKFNCGAKKIVVADGRVRGVVTEQGDEVLTDYVVSNAGTVTTYVELIEPDHVPAGVLTALGQSTIGPSAFTLYLGLDCEPAELGLTETTNFIAATTDMDRAWALGKTLEPCQAALLTCYDVSDPDFSPPGASQVALVALQYAEPWLSVPPAAYAEEKYRYGRTMLDLAERVVPGISDHVEECEPASPLTHLRYLGHPGGAIYGFDKYAKDSNLFVSPRSPIRGLYFSGAWAGDGGFQPTLMSGQSAARAVLRAMAKQGGAR